MTCAPPYTPPSRAQRFSDNRLDLFRVRFYPPGRFSCFATLSQDGAKIGFWAWGLTQDAAEARVEKKAERIARRLAKKGRRRAFDIEFYGWPRRIGDVPYRTDHHEV